MLNFPFWQSNFALKYSFDVFFLQLWHQYDTDGSGYIEADELKVKLFLKMFSFLQTVERESFVFRKLKASSA
jgi:hypothetical protein